MDQLLLRLENQPEIAILEKNTFEINIFFIFKIQFILFLRLSHGFLYSSFFYISYIQPELGKKKHDQNVVTPRNSS